MLYQSIVYYAFLGWAAIQMVYAAALFTRVLNLPFNRRKAIQQLQRTSIVICAKNEEANLAAYLPQVLSQEYYLPDGQLGFEVLVVDDASTDGTPLLLKTLSEKFSHLRYLRIEQDARRRFKGKKEAQAIGAAAANYDFLLLTDADCQPASNQWLTEMVAPLLAGKTIVAGYGAYTPNRSVLNAFTRWETIHSFTQWATIAVAGWPYMGVGRNIACTRTALLEATQSPLWNASASGDDDMLVRICATPNNYQLVCCSDSFTYTPSEGNFAKWIKQKQRHLSTGKNYKPWVKFLLGTYGFTHAGVWFYFPFGMFTAYHATILWVMVFRCLVYWMLIAYTAVQLKDKRIIPFIPMFDFTWMLYNFTFLPYIAWKSKQTWK